MQSLRLTSNEREENAIDAQNATKLRSIYLGLCSSCEECHGAYGLTATEFHHAMEAGELVDEGGFSMHDCELCGSTLGGDRFAAHGIADDGSTLHYNVCVDCVQYLANGEPYPDES